ncbi:PEK protein kinase [Paracoccidioides lutzii Pb01]|uniref:PEK protein kinase n=1 Tax=Paracoccidioides lutzii (strain ATCC MYA-826 / Pb01) TaxID=502779 RepID=A0A0A2V4H1_PARBA|nr:PEK protein kinase [Paracoccidioides lutzii Pb01]KGQ01050.1 PEK protein kinase [Paracoccidioides lutzii Pb01]
MSSDSEFQSEQLHANDVACLAPSEPKDASADKSTSSLGNSPLSHEYGTSPPHEIERSARVDQVEMPELSPEGQAAMMTAALLEFYCESRAADILNGQPGSHGGYSRDSPEAKYLGRHLYMYKSQFLSGHGVIAGGLDGNDWESVRKHYRNNLDVLSVAALGETDPNGRHSLPPFKGASGQGSATMNFGQLQKLLEGLDLDKIKNFTPQQPSRPNLQRRITDKAYSDPSTQPLPPNIADLVRHSLTAFSQIPMDFPLLSPQTINIPTSRYAAEFEEEAFIGKGSYGAVYRARHHVDSQVYAVKKIPLREKRLRQLQRDGLRAVESILKEIRTLARLEHPNVVRYFSAWAELSTGSIVESASSTIPVSADGMDDSEQVSSPKPETSGSHHEDLSFSIVFEESGHGIVFENSLKDSENAEDKEKGHSDSSVTRRRKRLSFQGTNGKSDTGDVEEVESLPRPFSFPNHGQTTSESETNDDIFSDGMGNASLRSLSRKVKHVKPGPVLTLHIQMSLHPLSLATYLVPRPATSDTNSPRHCYHLIPSLKIILGVLAGVEYLHSMGIVHRDLKPANIFLSLANPQDKMICPPCDKKEIKRPWYTNPRIGDFGLVAEISQYGESRGQYESGCNSTGAQTRPVGTEFYRPPTVNSKQIRPLSRTNKTYEQENEGNHEHAEMENPYDIDESLDMFALGVILFELLYKFETRMERQMTLCYLTCSPNQMVKSYHERNLSDLTPILPGDFASKINCSEAAKNESENDGMYILNKLTACIKGMLDPDSRCRWTCKDVQRCLNEILSMCGNLS